MTARRAARAAPASPLPGDAVGPRGVALLRRVHAAGGSYRCERNADRDAIGRCARNGCLLIDPRDRDILYITDAGVAFLDRLMRAH